MPIRANLFQSTKGPRFAVPVSPVPRQRRSHSILLASLGRFSISEAIVSGLDRVSNGGTEGAIGNAFRGNPLVLVEAGVTGGEICGFSG